jgi:hypothetical protein
MTDKRNMNLWIPEELAWVFHMGEAETRLRRTAAPDATRLIVDGPKGTEILDFATHAELVRAQADYEGRLVETGWRFVGFIPERRQVHNDAPRQGGIERRGQHRA